jgi:hypothetical protein
METLLDIKKALEKVPDELLGNLFFGCGEGAEDEVNMLAPEGSGKYEFPEVWDLVDKEYPQLNELNKLVKNIARVQVHLDEQEDDEVTQKAFEEPITSSFFDKDKK